VDRVVEFDPLMAGDDFSAYLRVAPGCYFFVGAGDDAALPHHHPRFTIDERAAGGYRDVRSDGRAPPRGRPESPVAERGADN
jgi:hypothetical protein